MVAWTWWRYLNEEGDGDAEEERAFFERAVHHPLNHSQDGARVERSLVLCAAGVLTFLTVLSLVVLAGGGRAGRAWFSSPFLLFLGLIPGVTLAISALLADTP